MKITAEKYWTEFLPNLMKQVGWMPERHYRLITSSPLLYKHIDSFVIQSWLSNEDNYNWLVSELLWAAGCFRGNYYMTCTESQEEIEHFVEMYYKVDWVCDDYIIVEQL